MCKNTLRRRGLGGLHMLLNKDMQRVNKLLRREAQARLFLFVVVFLLCVSIVIFVSWFEQRIGLCVWIHVHGLIFVCVE